MDNDASLFACVVIYLLAFSAFTAYHDNSADMLTISPTLNYEGYYNFTEINSTVDISFNYEIANPYSHNAAVEIDEYGLHATLVPLLSDTRIKFSDLRLYDGNISCYYDIYTTIENEHFDIEVRDQYIGAIISTLSQIIIYVQNDEIHLVSGISDIQIGDTDSSQYNIGFEMDESNNYLEIYYNYNLIYEGNVAERYLALTDISYGIFGFYDTDTYLQGLNSNFVKSEDGFSITDVWSFISTMGIIIVWSNNSMPWILNLFLIKTADLALLFILIKIIRG